MSIGKGYPDTNTNVAPQYVTVLPMSSSRNASDVIARGFAFLTTAAVEAGSDRTKIISTAHQAKAGDSLRFLDFTALRLYEIHVLSVTTNEIYLAGKLPSDPTVTETFAISRAISPQYDTTGKQVVKIDPPNGGFATEATQIANAQFNANDKAYLDFSVTNVTSGAWVELLAATAGTVATRKIQVFMSSGAPLILGFGASGSEVEKIFITPGGNGLLDLYIPVGTRLSLKAKSASATSGELFVNLVG